MEVAGVKDVLAKSIGSSSPVNIVKATMDGFARMKTPGQARALRGLAEPRHLSHEPSQGDAEQTETGSSGES